MPRDITINFADGSQHIYKGAPDDVTPEAVSARAQKEFGKSVASLDGGRKPEEKSTAGNVVMGALRGAKDVIDTGADYLASGFDKLAGTKEGERVRAMNDAGKKEFTKDYGDSTAASVARVGGQIATTWPVGGVLGAGAKVLGATRLGNALATGGFSTGAEVAPNLLAQAGDMGIRMAGGGATGYVGGGLVDPDSANMSGAIGALLPPVAKGLGAAGNVVGNFVKPFFSKGQDQIAGGVLRKSATNADEALRNIRNVPEMVPGSVATTAAAAGDEGLAGLSRTLQSADPRYAAELATRGYAQNAARSAALEEVAGNTGKIAIAEQARKAVTDPMREAVLNQAGQLPARSVLDGIDRLMAKPDNAGELAQSALSRFRNQIAKNSPDGLVDARALYAIRKDIGQMMEGKLQGEAGNLRYASGQLKDVKGLIDDAIDQASRRVTQSTGREVVPYSGGLAQVGDGVSQQAARPTWKGYLDKYTQESIPINQMQKLEEVKNAISTGAVDKDGSAILSAAKMNNYLRINAKDLEKELAPEQLDLLRRVSADLNASQLAATSGKALGSNTVQNLSGVNTLNSLVGKTLGGSSPLQSTLGRSINWLYKKPDEAILNKLSQSMLDPQEAARLMQTPEGNRLLQMLAPAGQIGYRAAPAISAQR